MYPNWVRLFFLQGAKLPDPGKHLRGKGKVARHIVLDSADDLDKPEILTLIEQALERAKVAIDASNVGGNMGKHGDTGILRGGGSILCCRLV